MDAQVPHGAPETLRLADNLGRALEQRDEDVERTAANLQRSAVLLDEPLGRMEAKRTERRDSSVQGGRADRRGIRVILFHGRLCVQGSAGNQRFCRPARSIWMASVEALRHRDLPQFRSRAGPRVHAGPAAYWMSLSLRACSAGRTVPWLLSEVNVDEFELQQSRS